MNFLSINSIYKEIKWRLLFKKLRKIEFLILDVDGVLTDGGLWFQNDGYILKRFDVKDGLSLNLAQEAGIKIILISGGEGFCTEIRASQLGIKDYFFGVKDKYKKVLLEAVTLDHNSSKSHILNTNGVDFEVNKGMYGFSSMFTSKDGKDTSSFNYTGVEKLDLNQSLDKYGHVSELLRQSEEQVKSSPINSKFVGEIIVTPHCLSEFISFIDYSISDNALISGTSIYKDKVDEKIASETFTLSSNPVHEKIDSGYHITSDTYKSKNQSIIKNGVLQTHLLSLYGANKTGGIRVPNQGGNYMISGSTSSLDNMIKNIKKGILLCRFSGGSPSDSGDFSGVAKNSYYIENGQIKFPIIETMISGNIAQMFLNIKNISHETVDFGDSILPWISFDGITVS